MKKRYTLFSILFAVLLIGVVAGVTYAFFNYTRTGTANTVRTGRINFNAEQGEEVTLSDLFPISASGTITPSTPGVGSVTVHVTGDTNYDKGVEYIVKSVNVSNGSGGSSLPISVSISYSASAGDGKTIGEADDSYYINRGGSESIYRVLSADTISEGEDLVVGYIAPGETGIDGVITIMAYLDANNIAITDTYPNITYYEVNDNLTEGELAECVNYLSALNATNEFCNGTGTISNNDTNITFQQALDTGVITTIQKEYLASENIIYEIYTDGTDDNWVEGRTVLTTEEWNALSSDGVSFKIKVEANQGVWVPATIDGTATITPTGTSTANISVIQADLKYETTVTISGDTATYTNGILSKYNSTTSSYDNVTTSDKYNKVNISLQHNNCNSGNAITVTNHASSNYIDGLETLDTAFVQCLITNNQ